MPRVVVIGGGIAGLAAAYELRNRAEVTLIEATDRVGGKLRTSEIAGIPVDEGAESMLARVPEAVGLAREIGCDIVHPATASASIWVNNRLRRCRPARFWAYRRHPVLLSALGSCRLRGCFGLVRILFCRARLCRTIQLLVRTCDLVSVRKSSTVWLTRCSAAFMRGGRKN